MQADRSMESLYAELVSNGVLVRCPQVNPKTLLHALLFALACVYRTGSECKHLAVCAALVSNGVLVARCDYALSACHISIFVHCIMPWLLNTSHNTQNPQVHIQDYLGCAGYMGATLDKAGIIPDPSMAQVCVHVC